MEDWTREGLDYAYEVLDAMAAAIDAGENKKRVRIPVTEDETIAEALANAVVSVNREAAWAEMRGISEERIRGIKVAEIIVGSVLDVVLERHSATMKGADQ